MPELDLSVRCRRAQEFIETLRGSDAAWATAYLRYWRGTGAPEPKGIPHRMSVELQLRGILAGG